MIHHVKDAQDAEHSMARFICPPYHAVPVPLQRRRINCANLGLL